MSAARKNPPSDLRRFAAFSETAEPKELVDVLREFHHGVGPMIFEHEGANAQLTGDGLLVFFNDPVKLDDPAWNAVQLAVAMRDRTAVLSTEWKRRGRTEYTAIGTVVNLSARVCAIAAGNQILVTNKVLLAVEDRVESAPIGDTEFKGISRPVPIHEITTIH